MGLHGMQLLVPTATLRTTPDDAFSWTVGPFDVGHPRWTRQYPRLFSRRLLELFSFKLPRELFVPDPGPVTRTFEPFNSLSLKQNQFEFEKSTCW